jgi:hypothetical protein
MPPSQSPLPAAASPGSPESAIEVAGTPEQASAAVERAAELWGAEIEGRGKGRFHLRIAVTAGLRRGWMAGEVATEAAAAGARVVFRREEGEYHLQTAAVGILVLGALGAIAATLWPLVPSLLPLAPIGIILGLCAWFLVLSRLHSSGPEEFLEAVAGAVGQGEAKEPEEGA